MLAAGDDLTREQQQRALGLIHQHQRVDLRATGARVGMDRAANEWRSDVAGFGDDDFAAPNAFIERKEARSIEGVRSYDREDGEIALGDG